MNEEGVLPDRFTLSAIGESPFATTEACAITLGLRVG